MASGGSLVPIRNVETRSGGARQAGAPLPPAVRAQDGGHPEGSGRIEAIDTELSRHDWLGWEQREAPAVDLEVLRAVHLDRSPPARHVEAERGGGALDAVHHGNGTNDIFHTTQEVLFDEHPPIAALSGHGPARGLRLRSG